jgi:hypothetical protein
MELQGTLSFDYRGRVIYRPGDIVGVRGGKGPITWLSYHCVTPQTPLFHFLLIGDHIQDEDDFVVLESVAKGVTVGRLSWYNERQYVVFRVNDPDADYLGRMATEKASKFDRYRYDWKLYVKIFAWALGYWLKEIATLHIPPRPVYPSQIPYATDRDFICIELVFEAWKLVGKLLRQKGHAPVPAEIILAQDRGDLVVIDDHDGNPANWRNRKSPLYRAALEMTRHKKPSAPVDNKPGPDIIGRQGGQKRNRVHIYRQPFGYPIRLCDWTAQQAKEIEIVGQVQGIGGPGEPKALAAGLDWAESMKGAVICKHCRRIAQGIRESVGLNNHGHGTGAPTP